MTRDEIISMAREAGARVFGEKIVIADNASSGDGSEFVPRFAALVAARERAQVYASILRGLRSENDSPQLRAIIASVEADYARADNEVTT